MTLIRRKPKRTLIRPSEAAAILTLSTETLRQGKCKTASLSRIDLADEDSEHHEWRYIKEECEALRDKLCDDAQQHRGRVAADLRRAAG